MNLHPTMWMADRLSTFLKEQGVTPDAPPTLPRGAAAMDCNGDGASEVDMAVRVLVVGDDYALLLAPAGADLPRGVLHDALGAAGPVRLASEAEIRLLFPDCEPEAVPPFGGAYGLPVHASRALARYAWWYCPAGRRDAWVRVRREAFERLASVHWIDL